MFKIDGLDKIQSELKELGQFTSELNGEIGTVSFDPELPKSVDNAIHQMEKMVDERANRFYSNTTIMGMLSEIKSKFKQQIVDKANSYNAEEEDN